MTMVGSFLNVQATSLENPATPLTGANLFSLIGGEPTASGERITEEKSLTIAGVYRSAVVASGVPASLPFHAFRDVDQQRLPAVGWAADLMSSPHPDMVPFELWQTVHLHRRLWGNAYLRILRDRLRRPVELWPIHPSRVKVGRESDVGQKVYAIDGSQQVFVGDEDILHLPWMGYDGICGVSPIRAARESLGLAKAAETYGAKLFGSGSLATGILQTEQRLTQKQADQLHSRWREKRAGLASAHDTIVLDKGATFTQLTIPPEDAQFLESRTFQISEICRWMGIPPFLMFQTEKSTSWGTGLEQQLLGWLMIDLRPDLVAVEQRVSRVLRPASVYARHAIEGLLRGDSAARAAFYTALFNIGALSSNDIRRLEDQPPIAGGDTYYRPLNMAPLTAELPNPNEPAPAGDPQKEPADA